MAPLCLTLRTYKYIDHIAQMPSYLAPIVPVTLCYVTVRKIVCSLDMKNYSQRYVNLIG